MHTQTLSVPTGAIVSGEEWMKARLALLEKEQALTRSMDRVTDERRRMPGERMEKPYVFDSVDGPVGLADLFGQNRKLIVRHFMFAPEWEEGCQGCSFGTDADQGILPHLESQGFSFAAISLAPLQKLQAFRQKMGWAFNWVSSGKTGFDHDFHVAFTPEEMASGRVFYNYRWQPPMEKVMPGMSFFEKAEDGSVLHVWSGYGREGEQLIPSLVVEPVERNADGPRYDLAGWVKLRHRYGSKSGGCCH